MREKRFEYYDEDFYDNGEYADAMHWFLVATNTQPLLNLKYGEEFPKQGIENCRVKLR